MHKNILLISNTVIFILCIILLASSCNKTNQNQIANFSNTQNDSISIWIKEAKSAHISKKNKHSLLAKAYQNANAITVDSLKLNYFSELSLAYYKLDDSLLFREINTQTLQLAIKTKDSIRLAEAHWDLAGFLSSNAVKDSAYYHYSAAQKTYSNLNDTLYSARMLYNMGHIQSSIGDYTSAEITVIKAIALFKSIDKKHKKLYNSYNLLANTTASLKEYSRALEYHKEALFYLKKNNDKDQLLAQTTNNNIGVVYQKQGQHKKAIQYLSKVIAFDSIYYKNTRLYGKALINLGYNKLEINDTGELPDLLTKGLKISDSIGAIESKSSASYNLALYYLKKGDSSTALYNLQKSKKYAQQTSDSDRLLETLRLLPKVNPKNTATYTQEYILLIDSLQQYERKIRDKFTRIRFETEEINAENQLINAENELLTKQKQLWTVVAFILLVIGFATFIIINQRTKNKILQFRQKQQISNQEIFNLLLAKNQNIEEGKQIEQKRISEELHDGVLGKMLGARMILLGLNKKIDEKAVSERAKAISILQGVEGEVRSISHELSHAAYQKINNFILSIQDLLETIQNASKIEINFKFAETLDWDDLSGDIKINLYRITQEIIQNSVKHSECNAIDLSFLADDESLKISITDNGKGFKVKKESKGIGMRNINSRIKKINGSLYIDSEITKGTKVTLAIPIIYNDDKNSDNTILTEDL